MKKDSIKGYLILGILFAFISAIVFVIPTPKTAAFWTSYGFTALAFIAQIFIWRKVFSAKDSLKSKFLGIPIVHIGIVYLILQVVSLAAFAALLTLPLWSAIITNILILSIFSVCMILADITRSEIGRVEKSVQKKVFYIKDLQSDIELLAGAEADMHVKYSLERLAEAIRYSDPMSCDQLTDIETKISANVEELKIASDKAKIADDLVLMLAERNKICKLLK